MHITIHITTPVYIATFVYIVIYIYVYIYLATCVYIVVYLNVYIHMATPVEIATITCTHSDTDDTVCIWGGYGQ